MPGRYLSITLALFLMAVVAVEVETASPLPGSPTRDGIHMILPDGEANRYWPRWRGPTGQGLAVGTGYPDTWSATQNVLWKVEVPGRGNSSPIVWADRIFLTTARDGGKLPLGPVLSEVRREAPLGIHPPGGRARQGLLEELPRLGHAGH